ncbi:STOREKEEPER protein-like [Humulus lupulus]|uniref:STOREKEEPER protein-like n=1 Tax=Humulus lupulus TaxID=3486 RepID=UPI002B418588|nr:STOREKEEPER protein-like [Humulus lupulus]
MAPRRLKEAPPPADSSSEESESESEAGIEEENGVAAEAGNGEKSSQEDDDEDDSEEEDEDDGEEDEKGKLSSHMIKEEESDSGSDSETDSDSDSDSDNTNPPSPTTADFTIKPSKSIEDSVKSKVQKPTKPSVSTPAPATPTTTSKRAAEKELEGKNSKKKKATDEEDPKQLSAFQRLWSDDDEIEILKGLIDYQSKKGKDPTADMNAFLEFIKKNLHVDVEKRQLSSKISRLKKKYLSNSGKVEKGEESVLSKPHDRKSFELSKKIWGSTVTNGDGSEDSAKSAKNKSKPIVKSSDGEVKTNPTDPDEFWSNYPCLTDSLKLVNSIPENLMKQTLPLIASSKLKELENKWKKLHMEGIELQNQRNELTFEQSKLILKLL